MVHFYDRILHSSSKCCSQYLIVIKCTKNLCIKSGHLFVQPFIYEMFITILIYTYFGSTVVCKALFLPSWGLLHSYRVKQWIKQFKCDIVCVCIEIKEKVLKEQNKNLVSKVCWVKVNFDLSGLPQGLFGMKKDRMFGRMFHTEEKLFANVQRKKNFPLQHDLNFL